MTTKAELLLCAMAGMRECSCSIAPPRRCGALQEALWCGLALSYGLALLFGLGVRRAGLLVVVNLLRFVVAAVRVVALFIWLLFLLTALHYGGRFVLIVGISIVVVT